CAKGARWAGTSPVHAARAASSSIATASCDPDDATAARGGVFSLAMKHLHVMVGILRDREGRVLMSRRTVDRAHPGRWEFPGGKLEAGEAPEAGLRRELREELGIVAGRMHPLIRIHHDYPDFRVLLDVREQIGRASCRGKGGMVGGA